MNVLSLFDGMSCGYLALKRININIDNYYSSEIDKFAILESKSNFPDIIRLGDVKEIKSKNLSNIDLLIGGSPCQSFSFSGKREGMITKDKIEILSLEHYLELKNENFEFSGQSYLFWEYIRILKELKPKYFLLENVVMSKKWENLISETIGVKPIMINSALVSAQQRKRLYWTNIPNVEQPKDKNINLEDILEDLSDTNPAAIRGRYLKKATIVGRRINAQGHREDYNKDIKIVQCLEVRKTNTNKSNCITTVQKDNVLTSMPVGRHVDVYGRKLPYRNYTLKELCRLQTVPDDFFKVSSENQARKMLGNGWNIDTITHILKNIK